ncbi:transglycosylase family protein, partial [Streptomyces racemochromogenes]
MPKNKPTTRHTRPLLTLAISVAALTAASQGLAHAASVSTWDKVAQCESTGNWTVVSANGLYYGGLQISLPTWKAYGGTTYASRPDLATKKQQILIAEKILAGQGAGAWTCAPGTGLSTDHTKPYADSIGAYDPNTATFYESNDNVNVSGSARFGNPGWLPLAG